LRIRTGSRSRRNEINKYPSVPFLNFIELQTYLERDGSIWMKVSSWNRLLFSPFSGLP
jgi:hypothetical protein